MAYLTRVNHPTNTTTMVVPFATPAAWWWRISPPHSLGASVEGFGGGQRSRALFNLADWPRKKLLLNCCCFAEREGGKRAWCRFLYLHEDPSPHVCRYSFSKNNVSHACILEQLVELDVEATVCFTVVERQEVFTQLPRLVAFDCGHILDHHFDWGVQVFCPCLS